MKPLQDKVENLKDQGQDRTNQHVTGPLPSTVKPGKVWKSVPVLKKRDDKELTHDCDKTKKPPPSRPQLSPKNLCV